MLLHEHPAYAIAAYLGITSGPQIIEIVDKTMAILVNHLAAIPRPTNLLPPNPPHLLAARWTSQFGRCPAESNRSAAGISNPHRFR